MQSGLERMSWDDQSRAVECIKNKCFQSGEVNPSYLNADSVRDAKNRHHDDFGSIEDGNFLTAFKRAAAEWILDKDLKVSRKENVKRPEYESGDDDNDHSLKPEAAVRFCIPIN